MSDTGRATAAAVRIHADRLDELRRNLEAVRFTSTLMVRDPLAYGTMCAWIVASLDDRFARQDELIDRVTGNLSGAAGKLRETAAAYEGAAGATSIDAVAQSSFWAPHGSAAPMVDLSPGPRLADQIQILVDHIAGRSWVDPLLARREPDPEANVPVVDYEPVRELIDRLVGRPEVVASQTKAWSDMSIELHRVASELERALDVDIPEWTGEAHAAYAILMDNNANALGGTGATAAALASAVEGAGAVTLAALDLVRERSEELAAQLVAWAGRTDTAATVQQLVAAVARWALMVMTYLTALARSLQRLQRLLGL